MENEKIEKLVTEAEETRLIEAAKLHAESAEGKEMKGEELMKKAIQSVTQTVPVPEQAEPNSIQNPLTDYTAQEPEEVKRKIEDLLQIAATDGIVRATEAAKHASPFILDAFHDALAAKVYPYLREKGLFK